MLLERYVWVILTFSPLLFIGCLGDGGVDKYLGRCLSLGNLTKSAPGPEPNLECPNFRDRACCNVGSTNDFATDEIHRDSLIYNQCPSSKPRLSKACHDMMYNELCFFVCSPNISPWRDPVNFAAYHELPICQRVCNAWWDACKEEYTCTKNWYELIFGNGTCNDESTCDTYMNHYGSANTFCNTIFTGSLKVVPDDQPCMQFSFDPLKGNPNDAVALQKAQELAKADAMTDAMTTTKPPPSGCARPDAALFPFIVMAAILVHICW